MESEEASAQQAQQSHVVAVGQETSQEQASVRPVGGGKRAADARSARKAKRVRSSDPPVFTASQRTFVLPFVRAHVQEKHRIDYKHIHALPLFDNIQFERFKTLMRSEIREMRNRANQFQRNMASLVYAQEKSRTVDDLTAKLNRANANLNIQLQESQAQLADLKNRMAAQALDQLSTANAAVQDEIIELKNEIKSLKAQHIADKRELDASEEHKLKLLEEIKHKDRVCSELKTTCTSLRADCDIMQQALSDATAKRSDLSAEVGRLKTTMGEQEMKSRAEIAGLQAMYEQIREELANVSKANIETKEKCEAQVDRLKVQLKAATTEVDDLKSQASGKSDSLTSVEMSNREVILRKHKNELVAKNTTLTQKVNELSQSLLVYSNCPKLETKLKMTAYWIDNNSPAPRQAFVRREHELVLYWHLCPLSHLRCCRYHKRHRKEGVSKPVRPTCEPIRTNPFWKTH